MKHPCNTRDDLSWAALPKPLSFTGVVSENRINFLNIRAL